MTSRIVLFLGKLANTREARYARWDRLDDASVRETRLPWLVLFDATKDGSGTEQLTQVVGICSDTTLGDWQCHLVDDICRAGFDDRSEMPIGFLTYDEDRLDPTNFWDLFEKLRVALSGDALDDRNGPILSRESDRNAFHLRAERVVVDITHGFRAIPFIGASALSFAQGANRRHQKNVTYRICYAAEQAEHYGVVPVWDLTPFAEGVELGDALDAFARHGRADDLSAFFTQSQVPAAQELADPMQKFADDLLLMRIPNLLTKSAPALREALSASNERLEKAFPSVGEEIHSFERQLGDLVPDTSKANPVSLSGLKASAVLAQRLWDTGRYVDLWNLLRESLLSGFSVVAIQGTIHQPGEEGFSEQRGQLEKSWYPLLSKSDSAKSRVSRGKKKLIEPVDRDKAKIIAEEIDLVSDLRNDVAHCSMRENPKDEKALREALDLRLAAYNKIVLDLEKS